MNLPRRLPAPDTPDTANTGDGATLLFDTAASRAIEQAALAATPAHALMERAGFATARLACALAPAARTVWVAAGPGNNGGDGLVAARWLHAAGKQVHVTWLGQPGRLSADAAHAHHQALMAGLSLHPASVALPAPPDIVIDALLGLGQRPAPEGEITALIAAMNRCREQGALLLAVDLPTGLCADTGRALGTAIVRADATLSLLTAKPGLFTAQGRDAAGKVWWDGLGVSPGPHAASARLAGPGDARAGLAPRRAALHATHKGSFGDVWVVGGAPGMTGAALLAARASLRAGAGRVYVGLLDESGTTLGAPELMQRNWHDGLASDLVDHATVVCGCGGGDAVRSRLPTLIQRAARLVLDADALNAIAEAPGLAAQLESRGQRGAPTVLTPHPLEAARLLGTTTTALQLNRRLGAQQLADRFGAVVVLKGSGSVVAAPGLLPAINPSGNARLATAGTGDVLAGWLAGCWSTHNGSSSGGNGHGHGQVAGADQHLALQRLTAGVVWLHGRAAELTPPISPLPLTARALIDAMADAASALG